MYQIKSHLAYWRGRLQIEASQKGEAKAITSVEEDNSFLTISDKKGSINKNKWQRRFEELVSF